MAASAEYLDFIKEQMSGFGPVTVRRMFGGAGIFRDGLMFALVADETLYFKADKASQGSSRLCRFPPSSMGRRTGREPSCPTGGRPKAVSRTGTK